jgi:hypothetical protein
VTRPVRFGASALSLGLLLGVALAGPDRAAAATGSPDLSGAWARLTFGFEPPKSGMGPIGRYQNKSNVGGNFEHPNLTPTAAEVVKQRGAMLRSGTDFPKGRGAVPVHAGSSGSPRTYERAASGESQAVLVRRFDRPL